MSVVCLWPMTLSGVGPRDSPFHARKQLGTPKIIGTDAQCYLMTDQEPEAEVVEDRAGGGESPNTRSGFISHI